MNVAFELGVNLAPFLYREFHGAQLEQIIKGTCIRCRGYKNTPDGIITGCRCVS